MIALRAFFDSFSGMADVPSMATAYRIPMRPSSDAPMLKQGYDMLIDRIGDYGTNGFGNARVFGLRGVNCIGYIVQPDGSKRAAVWHSKDGTRINGPVDENLLRFAPTPRPKGLKAQ
jgi:hypothetical protein